MVNKENQLENLQQQADEVTFIMLENNRKVDERGEKLEDLDERAEDLHRNSKRFHKTSKKVKTQMESEYQKTKNMCTKLKWIGVGLGGLFLIILIAVLIYMSLH